jgi:uncharacterized membrane protein YgdD (TMEM256/DUF423 family)
MTTERLLVALGGVLGAAGVALLAVAAHGPWPAIASAGQMGLGHAPALIAIAVACRAGLVETRLGRLAGLGLAIGVVLFSADVTLFATTGSRLFPMAAPIGGTLTILSWLIGAAAALVGGRRDDTRF